MKSDSAYLLASENAFEQLNRSITHFLRFKKVVEMVTDNVTLFGEFQSMDTNQIFKQRCASGGGQRPQKV